MTIRIVSLFCGLGGWDLGLYQAAIDLGLDVRVVAAYDHWEPAVKCYNANLPHPVAEVCDIKAMDELPPHDLVIGGPPCQDHSLAGLRKCQCNLGEEPTPRCCLRDFVRLASDSPYVMENVVAKLINAGFSQKLCAADFGDVTSRKRWFYSNYLLHVIPTPGPRRIRDIRDHDEDARVLAKRPGCKAGNHSHFNDPRAYSGTTLKLGLRGNSASAFEDDEILGSVLSNSFHANEASKLVGCRNPSLLEMARAHSIPDSFDWCGATKTQRGQMIANSVPAGMAAGVSRAILTLIARERGLAA